MGGGSKPKVTPALSERCMGGQKSHPRIQVEVESHEPLQFLQAQAKVIERDTWG